MVGINIYRGNSKWPIRGHAVSWFHLPCEDEHSPGQILRSTISTRGEGVVISEMPHRCTCMGLSKDRLPQNPIVHVSNTYDKFYTVAI